MKRLLALIVLALSATAWSADAHHSLAQYIQTRADIVIGRVKDFAWTNPHTELVVLVRGDDGMLTEWSFEGVGTSRLAMAGFKKETMMPGDTISVVYSPRRDGKPGGMFVAVTLTDGRTLKLDRRQLLQGGGQRYE
jgi:Family of unknown function (DUF6152)